MRNQIQYGIVDCDVKPPGDYSIYEHRKGGKIRLEFREEKLYVNGKEVVRYLTKEQEYEDSAVTGHKLSRELKGKFVLNTCIMEYLIEHPSFIPREWKKGLTCFWGTIVRYEGVLGVPAIGWSQIRKDWGWTIYRLERDFNKDYFAACITQ